MTVDIRLEGRKQWMQFFVEFMLARIAFGLGKFEKYADMPSGLISRSFNLKFRGMSPKSTGWTIQTLLEAMKIAYWSLGPVSKF